MINGCQTCLTWRTPEAIDAGVTEDLLAGVARLADVGATTPTPNRSRWSSPSCSAATRSAIGDDLMARLEEHFDAGEIVELSLVIGKYLSQGRFMQVLGLDQACVVPDRKLGAAS